MQADQTNINFVYCIKNQKNMPVALNYQASVTVWQYAKNILYLYRMYQSSTFIERRID